MATTRALDHSSAPFHKTVSGPAVFLLRMVVFLLLVGFAVVIAGSNPTGENKLLAAFWKNQALNGLILFVLFFGIVYSFRQVLRLYPEIRWINAFRIADPGLAIEHKTVLLAPMATMLRDRRGAILLSASSMRSIMDSISQRLDEARDTGRYLVGLLVFLGLLGTFWGLLDTIQSIGGTFSGLSAEEGADVFGQLKKGLEGPMRGMGIAFSSSLLGLAGSLILGFLELQASHAQNRFYNELEEWLSGITDLSHGVEGAEGGQVSDQLQYAVYEIQRSLAELSGHMRDGRAAGGSPGDPAARDSVRELAKGVDQLVRQMRAEQKVVREWVDEQSAQQSEVASVLKDLAGNIKR